MGNLGITGMEKYHNQMNKYFKQVQFPETKSVTPIYCYNLKTRKKEKEVGKFFFKLTRITFLQ